MYRGRNTHSTHSIRNFTCIQEEFWHPKLWDSQFGNSTTQSATVQFISFLELLLELISEKNNKQPWGKKISVTLNIAFMIFFFSTVNFSGV